MGTIVYILFMAGVVWLIYYQSTAQGKKSKELDAIEKVSVGKYLVGLPDSNTPIDNVACAITATNLIFLTSLGRELGRIPRNRINQMIFDDKSQISQRLTVTRLLTLGIFSIAAPKKTKNKEYCIAIDWEDDNGIKWNTLFEFSGIAAEPIACAAANTLNKYITPRATSLNMNEKKCPYCAETIKKEAKICRFCNNAVS